MVLKIAIVTNSLSLGGAERVSVLLAEWLYSKGVEVAVVTLNKDREDGYKLNPNITRLAINSESRNSNLQIIFNLRKSLKSYNPSLVLIMGVPLCIRVVPALMGIRIPFIVSERNDPARFKGKKITKYLSRRLMKKAKGYVFQTNEAMEFYSESIQEKSTIIPNPLMVNLLPEPFTGKREREIVSAGRLVSQKNHHLLLYAFNNIVKIHPEYKLIIYGNGDERENLENLIKKLGLNEKVFLPGATDNIFNKLNNAEIFVLSSDYEGMPNALLEAMALGLPVISTDCPCGGPKYLIEDMVNGILTPVGDVKKLTESLLLLINDKELSARFGEEGIKVRENLHHEKICLLWYEFFKKVISDK